MKLIAGQSKSFLPQNPNHAIDCNSENEDF